MKKTLLHLILLFLFFSMAGNVWFIYQNYEASRVVSVIDGDSIDLKDGRRIRLLSVDAPEKDRCGYRLAQRRLSSLLADEYMRLTDLTRDDYGRILANVYVGDTLINEVLLREGLVRFTYVTSGQYGRVKQAFEHAKETQTGIWGPPCRTTSPPRRKNILPPLL